MTRRLAGLTALAALLALGALSAAASAAPSQTRVTLPGAVPSFTQTLPSLGATPGGERVAILANLRLRDAAGLRALIRHVSDPRSPAYGHYLTPRQFRARFAPSAKAASVVARFLRGAGFSVTDVPSNRHFVAATGTVAQAQQAFATRLRSYRLAGRTIHAPVGPVSVPAAIAPYVTRISGLDTGAAMRPRALRPHASAPPAFVNAGPCSQYWGQKQATGTPPVWGSVRPYVPCGYEPQQLQSAYGISSALKKGVDGRRVKVAVIDAYDSSTLEQDVATYSQRHGLPPAKLTRIAGPIATYTPEIAGPIDPQGWAGEETLDVEAVHAMAPGASIVYEGADSAFNISLSQALNDVVANKRAQIISNSYGSSGDFDNSSDDDPIFAQAAAQGIGIYFSSGDEGDETLDPDGPGDREVDAPANDPLVTAVGGTSLAVGSRGNYLWETGWGTGKSTLTSGAWAPAAPGDWVYGGGGGTSQTYAQPSWQKGIVPASIASYFAGKPAQADAGDANGAIHVPGRAVPDVALVGDPNTGFVEGLTEDFSNPPTELPIDDTRYGEYRIGGTSLSCPLFAGIMALADQAAGKAHGFANPALYAASKKGAYRDVKAPKAPLAAVRNDYVNGVDASGGTTTTLRTLNRLNTLHLLTGYDDATGLGSPNGLSFLRALAPKARL